MAAALRAPRNVDQYRDTSLDGLIGHDNKYPRVGTQHRANSLTSQGRRSVSDTDSHPMTSPPVSEVSNGPPIFYRRPPQEMSIPHRSFSQRAKARPFLREAIADDELVNDTPAESRRLPMATGTVRNDQFTGSPGRTRADLAPLQVNTAVSGQRPLSNSAVPRPSPAYASDTAMRVDSHRRQVSEPLRQHDKPMSAVSRASAARDTSNVLPNEQRNDWAPERSPLQKLEVTLNDISKEEKRARVEEAEMQLRESKSGRRGRAPSRDVTPKSATAPMKRSSLRGGPTADVVGVYDHSDPVQPGHLNSREPDSNRVSDNSRRGTKYNQKGHDQKRGQAEDSLNRSTSESYQRPIAQKLPESDQRSAPGNGPAGPYQTQNQAYALPRQAPRDAGPSGVQSQRSQEISSRFPQHNPVWHSGPQMSAPTIPSNVSGAPSLQGRRPPGQMQEDRDVSRSESLKKETNSSHKAALIAGAMAGSAAGAHEFGSVRTGSRKLQKAPPQGYDWNKSTRGGRRFSFESGAESLERPKGNAPPTTDLARELPVEPREEDRYAGQTQRTPRSNDAHHVGRGLQQTPPSPAGMEKAPLPSPQALRPRHASVSFKEPFERARPIDEWKNAGVARLTQEDFMLGSAPRTKSNKAWWESQDTAPRHQSSQRRTSARDSAGTTNFAAIDDRRATFSPPLLLKCGPLLRYTGMKKTRSEASTPSPDSDHAVWRGSVMIVTADSHSNYERVPILRLYSQPKRILSPPPQLSEGQELAPEFIDPIAGLTKLSRTGAPLYVRPVDHLEQGKDLSRIENDNGLFEFSPSPLDNRSSNSTTAAETNGRMTGKDGQSLGRYQEVAGVRIYADPVRGVTCWRFNLEIELGQEQAHIAYRINDGASVGFWVPSRDQSMNIMFHSCNGFSFSVDPDIFGGPDPLWRDVLNTHQSTPFHAMIGGGDQIYNDRVVADTQLFSEWTRLKNPEHKHHAAFTAEMKEELETFYFEHYCTWFSQGLFGMANSQIPMINIWDDHDIIDGFGSYPHHFMSSPVFAGLGNVAFKYYMLFQHQSVPEEKTTDEPSWILGAKPGPYITQQSRSLYLSLGKHMAFLGVDCRTERKRDEVLTEESIDNILERCRKELIEGETRHLIVLLGVPIAYPRLVWLETLLTSRAMDPVKALGRAGFIKGGFLNKFDGGVELLDDLDDHWTAKNHKHERNYLIEDLQDLAAEKSVRITILGGDVHLAAVGQFYSNPKLRIPKDRDHRYMPNVISSAIVNTPPSDMVADVLNRRNKVHHLNRYTDEQMVPLFTHDPLERKRNNKHLLPRRNWCSIREYVPGSTPPPTPPDTPSASGSELGEDDTHRRPPQRGFSFSREALNPRNLVRRISSRGGPPSAYRNASEYPSQDPTHPVDPNCPIHGQNGDSSLSVPPYQRRPSMDSAQPSQRPSSAQHDSSSVLQRPGFFRRPTNISEKAARKGNVPAVNPDGTEFDVNDHVNLEGGLDVVLNCEVHQGDVAGITAPYRLLVPALWYDGSSDREKLDGVAGVLRKPTLLSRLGSHKRPKQAQGEDYEDEDRNLNGADGYDAHDDHGRKPRGLLGLFSGPRRNRPDDDLDDKYDQQYMDQGHNLQNEELYDTEKRPPPHHELQQKDLSQPSPQQPQAQFRPQRQSTTSSKQSYVIGSQSEPRSQVPRPDPLSPSITSQSTPQTTFTDQREEAYRQPQRLSKQARLLGLADNVPYSSPVSAPQTTFTEPQDEGHRQPQRLSKQARLLGFVDDEYATPGQTPLRGDGIIGRDASNQYALESSDPSDQQQQSPHSAQGYSGVSAYRPPKPQRRWSLRTVRDRARSGTRWDFQDEN